MLGTATVATLHRSSLLIHKCRVQLQDRRYSGRFYAPRASSDSNSEGSTVDWDQAWSKFSQNVGAKLPEVESRVYTQAPRFAERRTWNSGQQQESIRRQERYLLNYWSQDTFFKGGGLAVLALFILLVLLAGPPPSDGRCTLPWC